MSAPDRYNCEEILRRLDDYLDRQLGPDEMRLVREHLETCAQCTSEHDFEKSVLENVRAKVQRIQAPPDLLGKITKALSKERDSKR